ncbi:hypothetical protein SLA2020_003400 [Shorea laevis]
MKVTTVTTATKTREFKRAPSSLSQTESELVSEYAMVAIVVIEDEDDESELRIETKMTTISMQIETGVMILMISSPKESRMLVGLRSEAIGRPNFGSILALDNGIHRFEGI